MPKAEHYDKCLLRLAFDQKPWHANIMEDIMRWLYEKMNWTGELISPKPGIMLNRDGTAKYIDSNTMYGHDHTILDFSSLAESGQLHRLQHPIEIYPKGTWVMITDPGTARLTNFSLGTPYRLAVSYDIFNRFHVVGDDTATSNGYGGCFYIGMKFDLVPADDAKDILMHKVEYKLKHLVAPQSVDPTQIYFDTDINGTLNTEIRYKNEVVYRNGRFYDPENIN